MQSKNEVVILGISNFEKWNRTVESNHLANQVRKKILPSYFVFAAWTPNVEFYNALDMSCPKLELTW